MTFQNTTIAVVGKNTPFKVMDDEDVKPYLDRIDRIPRAGIQAEVSSQIILTLFILSEILKISLEQNI